jgi:tRNA G10  N-methylase Trm11
MDNNLQTKQYIYAFSYDNTESELSKLESKYLFNQEDKDKLLITSIMVEPACSAFVKSRIEIAASSADDAELIDRIKRAKIRTNSFKVEYLVFEGDTTDYAGRLEKLNQTGLCVEGTPEYYTPETTYAICNINGVWYFGVLVKNNLAWQKHKDKPCSCSNSIGMRVAKALVNIASKADYSTALLDACCGVGTIMLEACYAGIPIDGCDINWRMCVDARKNLAHYNYSAKVVRSDIKDITTHYDAAIVDLPYNLFSKVTDAGVVNIIDSVAQITNRMVIISIKDISDIISTCGLRISDYCEVGKGGKATFARRIWVCEKC